MGCGASGCTTPQQARQNSPASRRRKPRTPRDSSDEFSDVVLTQRESIPTATSSASDGALVVQLDRCTNQGSSPSQDDIPFKAPSFLSSKKQSARSSFGSFTTSASNPLVVNRPARTSKSKALRLNNSVRSSTDFGETESRRGKLNVSEPVLGDATLSETESYGSVTSEGATTVRSRRLGTHAELRRSSVSGKKLSRAASTPESMSMSDDASVCSEGTALSAFQPKSRRAIPAKGDLADGNVAAIIDEAVSMHLSSLELENLDLSEIPRQVELVSSYLEELVVGHNMLRRMPSLLSEFSQLTSLDLSHNQITGFDEGLVLPLELTDLDVSHNQLSGLPPMTHLSRLRSLNLDFNEFVYFPDEVCLLEAIEVIFIAENHSLTTLPTADQVGCAPYLRQIAVDNVPCLLDHCKRELFGPYPQLILLNKIYPDKILDYLFVGSLRSAQTEKVYESLGIRYVVTCGRNMVINTQGVVRLELGVEDVEGESLANYFETFKLFVQSSIGNGNVLCHCFAGLSRSITMVLSYLMSHERMRLDTAIEKVLLQRPNIHPNATFMKELIAFDGVLFPGERPLDMKNLGEERTLRRLQNATPCRAPGRVMGSIRQDATARHNSAAVFPERSSDDIGAQEGGMH